MNVVIPIQHGGYTIRSWLYLKSSWLYPNIVVVITKLLCQIEFYQWLAQYDTDRCVSCSICRSRAKNLQLANRFPKCVSHYAEFGHKRDDGNPTYFDK